MHSATPLATAGGSYMPAAFFPPRLGFADGVPAACFGGGNCSPTGSGLPYGSSLACCLGQVMSPLHGDLFAKYLDYVKHRTGAAFHYAAMHPFLSSFLSETYADTLPKSSADVAILNKDSLYGSRSGAFCTCSFLRPGDVFGPLPRYNEKESSSSEMPLSASGRCEAKENGWMLGVRTSSNGEEANLSVIKRGADVYFRATKTVWRGQELILLVAETQPAASSTPEELADQKKDAEGFQCDRCGKMFAYKYYRDKHLKYTRCVDKGDRKFPCTLCDRSFEKRDRLRIHILHVHEKHRPHQCTVCAKRFSQSSSLNKHTRVHSGERPYKCMYCTKAFTASSILRTHIRQHSGEKPFKCKHCGKAFASHAAHDSHVRRTHKDTLLAKTSAADDFANGDSELFDANSGRSLQDSALQNEDDIDVVQ